MAYFEQFHILLSDINPWDAPTNMSEWKASIEKHLFKIASTDVGMALFNAIIDSGFYIAIGPEADNHCNAHGFGGATGGYQGKLVKGGVTFNPKAYENGSHCARIKRGKNHKYGSLPDEILFHELIHALRGGLLLNNATPVQGGLTRYSNTEEFLAIVITNIYISDPKNNSSSGLRAGHAGKLPLEKRFSRSLCFFASSPQILPLLLDFQAKQPRLATSLASVKANFNPLEAMATNLAAVEKTSNSKSTIAYDKSAEAIQQRQIEAYKAELRANRAAAAKEAEIALRSATNASPQELLKQMGGFAREALDYLR